MKRDFYFENDSFIKASTKVRNNAVRNNARNKFQSCFTFYFETHYFPHSEMINYNFCMSLDNKFDQKNLEHCVHGEMFS